MRRRPDTRGNYERNLYHPDLLPHHGGGEIHFHDKG